MSGAVSTVSNVLPKSITNYIGNGNPFASPAMQSLIGSVNPNTLINTIKNPSGFMNSNEIGGNAWHGGLDQVKSTIGHAGQTVQTAEMIAGIKPTPEQQAATDAANETAARTSAYNAAVAPNSGVDALTQQQISQMYSNGSSSSDIAAVLAASQAGSGVYGVRDINQSQQNYLKQTPGRAQTVKSLGYGSIL